MPVFKTYLKILKINLIASIIYIGIFVGLAILMAGNAKESDETSFKATSTSIGIVDRDKSTSSEAIIEYLNELHSVILLPDDKEVLQDELFYRNVTYILTIPEQFEEHLMDGTDISLESIKVPNSTRGIYVDIQLQQLLKTLSAYIRAGYDIPSAMSASKAVLSIETDVTLSLDESMTDVAPKHYYYYKFLPYILIAILIQTVSANLHVFNKVDVRKRNICSSLSLKSRNFQLALGSILTSLLVYVVVTLIAFLLYPNEFPQSGIMSYYLLNSFTFLIVCISIAYLIGIIANTDEVISALGNIISLGFSFLGGIFMPLSVMSDNVKPLARLVPTYWYTIVNDRLMMLTEVSGSVLKEIFSGMFVQICFALAFFSIALVISKKKAQQA